MHRREVFSGFYVVRYYLSPDNQLPSSSPQWLYDQHYSFIDDTNFSTASKSAAQSVNIPNETAIGLTQELQSFHGPCIFHGSCILFFAETREQNFGWYFL
jgi:hypothetical protein